MSKVETLIQNAEQTRGIINRLSGKVFARKDKLSAAENELGKALVRAKDGLKYMLQEKGIEEVAVKPEELKSLVDPFPLMSDRAKGFVETVVNRYLKEPEREVYFRVGDQETPFALFAFYQRSQKDPEFFENWTLFGQIPPVSQLDISFTAYKEESRPTALTQELEKAFDQLDRSDQLAIAGTFLNTAHHLCRNC